MIPVGFVECWQCEKQVDSVDEYANFLRDKIDVRVVCHNEAAVTSFSAYEIRSHTVEGLSNLVYRRLRELFRRTRHDRYDQRTRRTMPR